MTKIKLNKAAKLALLSIIATSSFVTFADEPAPEVKLKQEKSRNDLAAFLKSQKTAAQKPKVVSQAESTTEDTAAQAENAVVQAEADATEVDVTEVDVTEVVVAEVDVKNEDVAAQAENAFAEADAKEIVEVLTLAPAVAEAPTLAPAVAEAPIEVAAVLDQAEVATKDATEVVSAQAEADVTEVAVAEVDATQATPAEVDVTAVAEAPIEVVEVPTLTQAESDATEIVTAQAEDIAIPTEEANDSISNDNQSEFYQYGKSEDGFTPYKSENKSDDKASYKESESNKNSSVSTTKLEADKAVDSKVNRTIEDPEQQLRRHVSKVKQHFQHLTMITHKLNVGVDNRLSTLNAVAGGSEDDIRLDSGLWIKGEFNGSSQWGSKEQDYKNNGFVLTLGFDKDIIPDTTTIGAALSYISGTNKYINDAKQNDSFTGQVLSVYGINYFTPKLFVQGSANYGLLSIKDNVNSTAKTSSNGNIVDLNTKLGYDFALDKGLTFRPTVGLGYTGIHLGASKLDSVSKGSEVRKAFNSNQFTGSLGLSVSKNFALSDDIILIPELHGTVIQNFSDKNTGVQANIGNQIMNSANYSDLNVALGKTTFNVGVAINVVAKSNYTLGAGYDFYSSKDINNNSGFLKLKINL
jgi:hypothetical protein